MTQTNAYYVYVLFRPWDGSPCYVGKGKGRRAYHWNRQHNLHLSRIIKKGGGSVPSAIIRDGLTEEEAFVTERAFIKAIGRGKNCCLVNLTDGGEGASGVVQSQDTIAKHRAVSLGNHWALGCKRSEETITKLRVAQANRSPEHRARISEANRGRTASEETRAKQRLAKLGKQQSPELIAKRVAANTGKKRTPETCLAISRSLTGNPKLKTMLGKTHTEEAIVKMRSAAMGNHRALGTKHTQDSRNKMSIAQRGNHKTLGQKRSPEAIANMKSAQKIKWDKIRAERTSLPLLLQLLP